MKSPPSSPNPRKRSLFPESTSKCMDYDKDVVSSAPLVSRNQKSDKGKEVIVPDGFNIGDSDTAMFNDKKVERSIRRNAINYSFNECPDHKAKGAVANNFAGSSGKSLGAMGDNINYADLFLDDEIDVDEYCQLVAHLDSVDIPPGVEAPMPPIPWLSDPVKSDIKSVPGSISDTNLQAAKSFASTSHNVIDLAGPSTNASTFNDDYSDLYLEASIDIDEYAVMLAHFEKKDIPSGIEAPVPHFLSFSDHPNSNIKAVSGSSSSLMAQTNIVSPALGLSSSWKHPQISSTKMTQSYLQHQGRPSNIPVGVALSKSQEQGQINDAPAKQVSSMEADATTGKFKDFKQFDTVEDHSDHCYTNKSSCTMQKNWAKRIQEEWKILEKDLPDKIFVRVYETRIDLLRAVIVGAEGTPYHDGLFFFDVSFPRDYPNVPPHVYYHSGGLRLNPNLYECGKVCLSLLNTWSGGKQEKWIPGTSTMLQVLVSIQGLILNTEPYFNEPGYEDGRGKPFGDSASKKYNEDTFIFSLKTMVYMMKRPPKYFEDFVHRHFRNHAHEILAACKAYMDGAQVGDPVKGLVQVVNGNQICSRVFKNSLAAFLPILVKELTQIGANDCEKFLSPAPVGNKQIGSSMPQAAKPTVTQEHSSLGCRHYKSTTFPIPPPTQNQNEPGSLIGSALFSLGETKEEEEDEDEAARAGSVMEPQLNEPEKSNNNNKRARSDMDTDDVVEVAAPVVCSRGLRKNKEVILRDVIDIDKYDSADAMFIYEKIDRTSKGKAVRNSSDGYQIHQTKEAVLHTSLGFSGTETIGSVNGIEITEDVAPASNHFIDLDGPNSDATADDADDFTTINFEDFDYAFLQSHFDNVGIPPGIEAPVPHIPWLSNPPKSNVSSVSGSNSVDSSCQLKSDYGDLPGNGMFPWADPLSFNFKPTVMASSSFSTQLDRVSHPKGQYQSSWKHLKAARNIKKPIASHPQGSVPSLPVGAEPSRSQQRFYGALHRRKKRFASSSSTKYDAMKFNTGTETSLFGYNLPNGAIDPFGLQSSSGWLSDSSFPTSAKPFHSKFYGPVGSIYPPAGFPGNPWAKGASQTQYNVTAASLPTTPARQLSSKDIDEIMQKYKGFKQFDTVEDHSDHHYTLAGTLHGHPMTQPPKNWAKRIQEEWKSLEKDLPDTVFVRVYETRMDLLRAVIIGAEGTPYHDGLFFFDVSFPSNYPNVPPHVQYHSGGLRLNPNLYACGKVCLSLLNTWSGNPKEMWIQGVSTILQVLVSIQGLILNTKPYFNEPGYASMNGSADGEMRSRQYNEDTFLLSLTTMVYMMRRPPKHFEDFVMGHFRDRAHDILVACKAYMDGAQVGCLVKGGVQDVDEGDKSCSQRFKDSLAGHMPMLVKEFMQIGVKDCEKYLSPAVNGNKQIGSMPQATTSMVSC
ncbi:LOW QUALITY PROTEIN: uncharacterized protein LOC126787070 [Argentina anserina]|uniref:LOW QUALITY PROTEIN: uncharacterized protein LOC126787070 n=1 Tax=Argentina anserina TaxID=57926 RepID=UPI0021769196|nr:LOW QUALITY PROTEIN: uncharacterized protein LOC126787070 [Potentilla anserina]